jgi:hypothetical protein
MRGMVSVGLKALESVVDRCGSSTTAGIQSDVSLEPAATSTTVPATSS